MLLLIALVIFFNPTNAIRIFTSKVKITEYDSSNGGPVSGAHLVNTSLAVGLKSLSMCIRFNYKMLGTRYVDGQEGRNRLITIADFRTDGVVSIHFHFNYEYY